MVHWRASALLTLCLSSSPVFAQGPGTFEQVGSTLVSAMMMFLGNEDTVYILDKTEGNAQQIDGRPAWGTAWDINSRKATVMSVLTNPFCASGMHLPNGSFATFGGNGAVGPGGSIGSVPNNQGSASFDATYQDYDGGSSIRVLNPCNSGADFLSDNCAWYDDAAVLHMQAKRWYAGTEALADGSVVLIGGFVNGGYINRNFPVTGTYDPTMGGAAQLTYEFYPSRGTPATMQFMITTEGLSSYAHAYLMPSGNMFVQANLSTIMWDYNNNIETPLPDMMNGVARNYPASGAVAMLPLTPANNYTPTILFCGGSALPSDDYGNYSFPFVDTWNVPASNDCQRITPEPTDGSSPTYIQDDNMLETRIMGQFIILPDGTMLVINGGLNGTAGYAQATLTSTFAQMPFAESLASGPIGTPAIYDPNAPPGSRWSNAGMGASTIPRLYHSSSILLPDGSVMVAGSNPNLDVNLTSPYPTTYEAEIFYPHYFANISTRPVPAGIPTTISYGGPSFDITIPATSYTGNADSAAANTIISLIRGGFTTHAMNMGQRFLQLNNTFTVNPDSSITYHVSQAPPNANLFTPGPAMFFVTVNGVPSKATVVIVGNGAVGTQPTAPAAALPASVTLAAANGNGKASSGALFLAPATWTLGALALGFFFGL